MNKLLLSVLMFAFFTTRAQTALTEAVDFHVKTIYGETIYLFPLLDDNQQIVVIDFFSTSCGPCQDYADDFQATYEKFGANEGNVYFMGINWGNDNQGVAEFDSIFGLTYPTASGSQGGGNLVYGDYNILSYPTVIVITPDHQIVEQYIWVPDEENLTQAILNAGGFYVGVNEDSTLNYQNLKLYPQPAKGLLHIASDFNWSRYVDLVLLDLAGRKLLSDRINLNSAENQTITLEISAVPDGIYVLEIRTDTGLHTFEKVVVSNL